MVLEIEKRQFGNTGLKVSALGYGAGHIGSPDMSEKDAEIILNTVVDSGINLIDTARAYGLSEERIGKYLSKTRREDIIISTKVGYGVEGVPDWTFDSIIKGIDEARAKLQSDIIDIVYLHSCERHHLVKGEVVDALEKAIQDKKIRCAGYSGENESLDFSIYLNRLDAIQSSFNIFDQRGLHTALPKAKQHSMGVIAKRPIGNAPWRFDERPKGHYSEVYWDRMKAMGLDYGSDWHSIAIRFVAYWFGIDTAIIGTTNQKHLEMNIKAINKGKLNEEVVEHIVTTFRKFDRGWIGQV